jgi:hypothetical protein
MALAATLSLKKDDGTSEDFVSVDTLPSQPGTLRQNSSYDPPEGSSLYIRSAAIGSKGSSAKRHTQTIDLTVASASGALVRGSASLSLVQPNDPAFTSQMMIDLLHQLFDVYVSTSTFDVDDDVVKSHLR